MLMDNKGKKRNSPAALEAERRRKERLAREKAQKTENKQRPQPRSPEVGEKQVSRPEPRTKTPRRERDSRAARTAERQRKERKEDSRLEGLRQKQTREAKQRTHHRFGPVFWRRLLIILAVAAAVILTLTLFFRVKHVDVEGNRYYSREDIVAVCGINEGDNLLLLSRGAVAGNIMANCEYVSTVQVRRVLPNRVVIELTEHSSGYVITDTLGEYYLMASDGTVLKEIEAKAASSYVRINGVQIRIPIPGETAVPAEGAEGEDVQSRFRTLLTFLQELEAAELTRQVRSVTVSETNRLSLMYEDRFEVSLGTATNLAHKLEYLKIVIADQKEYDTGHIDLTYDSGKKAIVSLDD